MTRQLPEESIDLERYVASDQLSGAGMVRPEPRFRDRVVILNKGGIYYEPVVLYRTFARVIRKIWFLFLRLIFFFHLILRFVPHPVLCDVCKRKKIVEVLRICQCNFLMIASLVNLWAI